MKNNVKVSVITVVYNDVKNIEKTIKNVLKQTYTNLEYVVVDGASIDGTLDIIKRYEGKLRWISEPDKGIYDAMQKGANAATGEWIIFRNSGDFFISPDIIEKVFIDYIDKKEDFIACNIRYFRKGCYIDLKPTILNDDYLKSMPFFHPSTFIRRKTQLKFPFNLDYKYSADYCFFVQALYNGAKYIYFDIILSLFNNEDGISSIFYERNLKENLNIITKYGANNSLIKEKKREIKIFNIKKKIKSFIPFYSIYNRLNLKKQGWIFKQTEEILINI